MAAPQNAPLPPFFSLDSGMTIRLTALDPTTGAVVGGVEVSGASIDVAQEENAPEPVSPQPGTAFAFGDVVV